MDGLIKDNVSRSGRTRFILAMLLCSCTSYQPAYSRPAGGNMPQGNSVREDIIDRRILPVASEKFDGVIQQTARNSTPGYPSRVTAPAGAPNIILIMTDDVGFGAASSFGGPIPTPNLDRLAARGLLYNRFHTTALCSPSRAALLTGRNQHSVGAGIVTDMATGYPGYNSIIPKSAATVAEVLRQNGYNTAMFGKHHNVPMWESSAAGPFDRWPTGLGFEYFYGFIGGETNQWYPALVRNTSRVAQPDTDQSDSVLDRFLADDAIHWVHEQKASAPDKPFFLYYAPGTAHAPHQAPPDWAEKFKGRFDSGWDKVRGAIIARQKQMGIIPADTAVTARPDGLPAWESLAPESRQSASRMMEVFAGMLAFQDAQIGRLLDEIDRMGLSDNTLIMFIEGDNGSSSEGGLNGSTNWYATLAGGQEDSQWRASQSALMGGPDTYQHFPVGWAWALGAPFPWFKVFASHLGGTRNPLVISWPDQIQEPGVRSQFLNITDIMPTILEAAQIPAPLSVNGVQQQKINGTSFLYSFSNAQAPGRRRTQYFELLGNRGIYHDGWWAGTTPRAPWSGQTDISNQKWELYNLNKDFAQASNVADLYPEKLKLLRTLWKEKAKANQVLPLDDSSIERLRVNPYRKDRTRYEYWGANIRIPDDSAPPVREQSFVITADVVIPAKGGNGPLVASGSAFGGWSFYLLDGRPMAIQAASRQPRDRFKVQAEQQIPPGPAQISYRFTYDRSSGGPRAGDLSISVNGQQVASGRVARVAPILAEPTETFDIGDDTGNLVTQEYSAHRRFDGHIQKITLDIASIVPTGASPGGAVQ